MRIKNVGELKKYLSQFSDNTEIKVFNGFVNDWHNIDVIETQLLKEKPSYLLELINYQNNRDNLPLWDKLIKGRYKSREWKLAANEVVAIPELKQKFSIKKILLFQGVSRGINTFDRHGTINY